MKYCYTNHYSANHLCHPSINRWIAGDGSSTVQTKINDIYNSGDSKISLIDIIYKHFMNHQDFMNNQDVSLRGFSWDH